MEDDFVDAQCHYGRNLLTNKSFDTQGPQGILQRSFFFNQLSHKASGSTSSPYCLAMSEVWQERKVGGFCHLQITHLLESAI